MELGKMKSELVKDSQRQLKMNNWLILCVASALLQVQTITSEVEAKKRIGRDLFGCFLKTPIIQQSSIYRN
jgi:hypothetical protein